MTSQINAPSNCKDVLRPEPGHANGRIRPGRFWLRAYGGQLLRVPEIDTSGLADAHSWPYRGRGGAVSSGNRADVEVARSAEQFVRLISCCWLQLGRTRFVAYGGAARLRRAYNSETTAR